MARDFPGSSNNYLKAPNPLGALDITGSMCVVAAWVRPDSATISNNQVAGKEPAVVSHGGYFLGNGRFGIIGDDRGQEAASAASITTGVWQHWLGWKSGTGADALKLYINGSQAASVTSNRTIPDNSADFTIGARNIGDLPFDGRIAEVAVWTAALNTSEIAALAKGANPLQIRRLSLAGYFPLWSGLGASVGGADLSGGAANLSLVGSVGVADGPPVMRGVV